MLLPSDTVTGVPTAHPFWGLLVRGGETGNDITAAGTAQVLTMCLLSHNSAERQTCKRQEDEARSLHLLTASRRLGRQRRHAVSLPLTNANCSMSAEGDTVAPAMNGDDAPAVDVEVLETAALPAVRLPAEHHTDHTCSTCSSSLVCCNAPGRPGSGCAHRLEPRRWDLPAG